MSIGQPGEFAPVLAKRVSSAQVLSTLITYLDTLLIYFEIQDCNLRYCNEVMLFAISDFSPCTYIGLSNISPAKETNLTNNRFHVKAGLTAPLMQQTKVRDMGQFLNFGALSIRGATARSAIFEALKCLAKCLQNGLDGTLEILNWLELRPRPPLTFESKCLHRQIQC